MSGIVGPDGRPAASTGVPVVEIRGKQYLYRMVDRGTFDPKIPGHKPFCLLIMQESDVQNVLWLAMQALARDIYSRKPSGSREFQQLCSDVGVEIRDAHGGAVNIAEDLAKIGLDIA